MEKKNQQLTLQNGLFIDLTLHDFSASLLAEFAQKIVKPYFSGNLKNSIKELMQKALAEQELVLSHISSIENSVEA
jgi:hypothetical protein